VYQNGRLAGILPLRRYRGALSSTTNLHTPVFGFLASNGTAAEKRELQSLRMFAPTPLGFLDRKAFEYGRPAYERAKGLARSILGERGFRLLKCGRASLTRARLRR
jgi:hypothetical protein